MRKHPDLQKKLQALYTLRVNPEIQSNVDLANYLGVSRQAISRWCRGTATTLGNSVPDYQIVPFANAFGIDPYWLGSDFEDFESAIKSKIVAEKTGPVERDQQIETATLPTTRLDILGRKDELKKLNHLWQDPAKNLVQIIGFGGVGKSSLINQWLSDLSADNYRFARKVYAWSFYWQGRASDMQSSGDFFIEHALQWFGDQDPSKGTPWAKAMRLANLIRSYRTLLILDGLEPLQYPPGPKVGEVESPAIALLIRELANDNNGLCVLTSRIPVADIERFQDGRVETISLTNLDSKTGVELLKNLGIHGDLRTCMQAVHTYSGHPLSLSLLAGYLSVVHQGDIREFRELRSLLDEQRNSDHVISLMEVYLDWFKDRKECELLFIVALYDRAVSLKDARDFAESVDIPKLTDSTKTMRTDDWSYSVSLLKEANLLTTFIRDGDLMMDCHPIVRDFVAGYLKKHEKESWILAHSAIFESLQKAADEQPVSMQEIEPLFRAVIHGAQAGRFQEAFGLYYEIIKKKQFSISTEISHHADHACLRALFEKEWRTPCSKLPEEAQIYLLTSAATNLIYLGYINEALGPSRRSINWFIEHERWEDAAAAAAPLVSMLIAAGKLEEAISIINELEEPIRRSKNKLIQAVANNFKGYAYHLSGQTSLAGEYFEEADEVITSTLPIGNGEYGTISSYYCKYLLDVGDIDAALNRSLKTFGWRNRQSWQVKVDTTSMLASDILVLGLIFMRLGDKINARKYLNKQVELLRSADEWLYLPTGLNYRAHFLMTEGEYDAALADLTESLEISTKTGASMGKWEAFIESAKLNLLLNNYEAAREYIKKAEAMPGMDAYKFRASEIEAIKSQIP